MAQILKKVKYDILAAKWLRVWYDTDTQEFFEEPTSVFYEDLTQLFNENGDGFAWVNEVPAGSTQLSIERMYLPS